MRVDYTQEIIFNRKRDYCKGGLRGMTVRIDGVIEDWFYCIYCNKRRDQTRVGKCPKYPFPDYTLRDLMKALGEFGHHTFIRYDALREKNHFTVVFDGIRVGDTEKPLELLCDFLEKNGLPDAPN